MKGRITASRPPGETFRDQLRERERAIREHLRNRVPHKFEILRTWLDDMILFGDDENSNSSSSSSSGCGCLLLILLILFLGHGC